MKKIRSEKQKLKFIERELPKAPVAKGRKQVGQRFLELKESGWGEVWDDRTLRHVATSEAGYARHFDRGTAVSDAEVLEVLMNWGISRMGWLGNFVQTAKDGTKTVPFKAWAESAREFDDKRHRIDTVVTLKLDEKIREDFPSLVSGQVVLGLDITTWKKDTGVVADLAEVEELEYFSEKISRSNNEEYAVQDSVPFGFSQVDFYCDPYRLDENGAPRKGCKKWVPRFVVGFDGRAAEAIVHDDFEFNNKLKKYEPKGDEVIFTDAKVAVAGMKVMLEIKAQAETMMQMMPDGYRERPKCVKAVEKLTVVRNKMEAGLKRSVERTAELMGRAGMLSSELILQIDGASLPQAVRILAMAFGNADLEIYDATYAGIMRAVAGFKECASDIERSRMLRKTQPRNVAVKWTGHKIHEIKYDIEERREIVAESDRKLRERGAKSD